MTPFLYSEKLDNDRTYYKNLEIFEMKVEVDTLKEIYYSREQLKNIQNNIMG
jgi:hypothetical protein